MKIFFRYFSLLLILGCFLSNQVLCVGALDIDDQSKDLNIHTSALPKFITEIFKERAEDLKKQISTFKYNKDKNYIIFEKNNLVFNTMHIASDDEKNNFIIKRFVEDLERSYKVFTNPTFFSITKERFELDFEVNTGGLAIFFGDVASEFSLQYGHILNLRSVLTAALKENPTVYLNPNFVLPHMLEAMLDVRNKTINDLANVIHAIRPHLTATAVPSPLKPQLQEIEKGLKKIAQKERTYIEEGLALARKVSQSHSFKQYMQTKKQNF